MPPKLITIHIAIIDRRDLLELMPFSIITGTFNPATGNPDGDSVRFLANDRSSFDRLAGRVKFKFDDEVQLRYQGIDALEKEAERTFASDATKRNLELLRKDFIERSSFRGNARSDGYILSNSIDRNGRPVCFVFVGDAPDADEVDIVLQPDRLRQSINYQLLEEGMVYPMFYNTLYRELRYEMTEAVRRARKKHLGVWKEDVSNEGFFVSSFSNLATLPPIFPKLWRRLELFYSHPDNQDKTVAEFVRFLAKGDDRLFAIPDGKTIKFSKALEVIGEKLRLRYKPEEMIFLS
jgi:endonuclease YncB( thermonuclease family)